MAAGPRRRRGHAICPSAGALESFSSWVVLALCSTWTRGAPVFHLFPGRAQSQHRTAASPASARGKKSKDSGARSESLRPDPGTEEGCAGDVAVGIPFPDRSTFFRLCSRQKISGTIPAAWSGSSWMLQVLVDTSGPGALRTHGCWAKTPARARSSAAAPAQDVRGPAP